MAVKRNHRAGTMSGALRTAAAAFLLAASSLVGAQTLSYRCEVGADGQPVFTQVLRWEGDPNALEYLVLVKDEAGTEILRNTTTEALEEVWLAPGNYDYKIITYNLLGKAEEESEWIKLEIIRAEKPQIISASPKVIYMDSLDGRISIVGNKLISGGRVFLKDRSADGTSYEGKVLQRKGNEELVVTFPDIAYEPGDYEISVENPGGLDSSLSDALRIRYQRPVDLLAALGYSPYLSLYDGWFTTNWAEVYNPLGFEASLDFFFIKAKWGFIGIEGQAEYRRLTGGDPAAVITSDYLLAGIDALYKYRFMRALHGLFRAGGGLSFSKHSFDYEGFAGPTTTSADPFAEAGIALQVFTPIKLYVEVGADWSCIFLKGHQSGGITPEVRVGYQLY